MSSTDIIRANLTSIQGNHRAVYLDGTWTGIVRSRLKGGDIFEIDGATWSVNQVLEAWPTWSKVAVTQQ
jgi:hypothetical protein